MSVDWKDVTLVMNIEEVGPDRAELIYMLIYSNYQQMISNETLIQNFYHVNCSPKKKKKKKNPVVLIQPWCYKMSYVQNRYFILSKTGMFI